MHVLFTASGKTPIHYFPDLSDLDSINSQRVATEQEIANTSSFIIASSHFKRSNQYGNQYQLGKMVKWCVCYEYDFHNNDCTIYEKIGIFGA